MKRPSSRCYKILGVDNNYSWQTITFRTAHGDRPIPLFLFEVLNAPVFVEGSNTVNGFMPALFAAGFRLTTSSDLGEIVQTAPKLIDSKVWFDLRTTDRGALYMQTGDEIFNAVEAPIGHADEVDRPFRTAASGGKVVLVIAGVGLNINPATGSYALATAAAAGNLSSAFVPALV